MATVINKEILSENASTSVTKPLLWMVLSGVISIANSILIWVFMARMRETEELGRFTIVMGLYALFYSVCSLGLMPFLVSEISRRNEQSKMRQEGEQAVVRFISSASVFLLISGIVCAVLMAACGFWASESWSVRVSTLILSLTMIPTGVIGVAEATAISYGRTRLIAFVTTLENVLRTLIPLVLIWFGYSISVICLSFVIARIPALLVYLLAAKKGISNFDFNTEDFVKISKVSPTFAGTIIFASINWQVVIILLGHYSTEVESAKYGVASRFLIPVSILMASYANVIQPLITQHIQKATGNSGLYLSKMARYPLILSTLAALISPFLSGQVLVAFFGENYADVAPTLNILAVSVVPFCLVMVVARGLIATNSQHIDLLANALGAVACFSVGAMLIPQYGAVGAALAQLISFLLIALVEISYLSKKLVSFNVWRTGSYSSACLLVIYLILWKF
ncbi:MAG TPA: polysaccharide biosynthesis C-terminal domain-containing protein [Pyrinomonadaceae bacterium]|jgi:O-antigen/teichoic acid export membrane protein